MRMEISDRGREIFEKTASGYGITLEEAIRLHCAMYSWINERRGESNENYKF